MASRKPNPFKHGFKTEAEKIALDFREKLSLPHFSHLPAQALAEYLEVPCFPFSDWGGDTSILNRNGVSALTMCHCSGLRLIAYNDHHSPARIQSDLMHELAHIIRGHKPPEHYKDIPIPSDVRSYNAEEEEEAIYLGGCLQIPRYALVQAFKRKMDRQGMSEFFNASLEMVRYRIGITGVERQVAHWR